MLPMFANANVFFFLNIQTDFFIFKLTGLLIQYFIIPQENNNDNQMQSLLLN